LAGLIIIVILLIVLFNPKLLPGIGSWLGGQSRKPYRQARWMWKLFSGTEDEQILAEYEFGYECARAFAQQFSAGSSRANSDLIATIGSKLSDAVRDSRRKFNFAVVESGLANAFALPGGFIFITGSLLNLCKQDQDEIAFFLGHEIGHVLRGHARDHMTASTLLNAIMSRLPAAGQMLRHVIAKGYSRMLELEADQEGIRLAAAAGFDARASIRALKKLEQLSPAAGGLAEYLSTHPPVSERISELKKHLR
jgi:beta-barrel assembly-enhancing protease